MAVIAMQHRYGSSRRIALVACFASTLAGCGLQLDSASDVRAKIDALTASPTPTPSPTASPTPGSGPSAKITGTVNGQATSFSYVLLNTDASGRTALEFLSYDPCLWVTSHSASTFPQDFNTLIVELVSVNAAPASGVYVDVAGTNNTSNLSIDPNSSFGAIVDCKGTWSALSAGTTVTITDIDMTQNTASGSLSAQLSGGGMLSGTFSTTTCGSGSAVVNDAGSDACSSLE